MLVQTTNPIHRDPRRSRSIRSLALECDGLETGGTPMWVIFLEAGLALAIFIFIIWWTMRGKR